MPRRKRKTRTVIVTGATGSFGRVVVPYLAQQGYDVHAVDRRRWPDPPPGVTFHQVDILKRGFDNIVRTVRPDGLVHLAMIHRFADTPEQRFRLNFEGTARVINQAYEAGTRKMVFASRASVYGALPDQPEFVTEDHPPGAGRMLADMQDLVDADLYASSMLWRLQDAEINVLRFVNVLGRTVTTLLQRYLKGPRVFTVAGFDPLYQVMHERDMAAAIEKGLKPGLRGVWNVTGPGAVPLHVLIDETRNLRVPIPEPLIRMLRGRLGFPDIPDGALAFLKHSCTVDGARFREATGYAPAVDLRGTLGAVAQASR